MRLLRTSHQWVCCLGCRVPVNLGEDEWEAKYRLLRKLGGDRAEPATLVFCFSCAELFDLLRPSRRDFHFTAFRDAAIRWRTYLTSDEARYDIAQGREADTTEAGL